MEHSTTFQVEETFADTFKETSAGKFLRTSRDTWPPYDGEVATKSPYLGLVKELLFQ